MWRGRLSVALDALETEADYDRAPVERLSPVETTNVQLPTGDRLQIPTGAETLRLKSYLIMCRNRSRDYAEFADLVDSMETQTAAVVLAGDGPVLLWTTVEKTMGGHPVGAPAGRPAARGRARHQDVGPRGGGGLGQGQGALPVGGRSDAGGGEVTVAPEIRDARRDAASAPNRPAAPKPARRPPIDDRPVEFWPTAAIRAALETDDLTVWQRIVVAIKRDPYGRTARQVEEVLETARPYGVSKALSEVLTRTREHLEANERAEVARHVQRLMERSGLGPAEFASRIGVPTEEFATYLSARDESVGVADDPDAPAVGSVRQDAGPAHGTG